MPAKPSTPVCPPDKLKTFIVQAETFIIIVANPQKLHVRRGRHKNPPTHHPTTHPPTHPLTHALLGSESSVES